MDASPTADEVLAEVHCRTFRGSQGRGLLLCVFLTMQATALVSLLGLPPTFAVAALFGSIALCLGWFTGTSRYRLTARGVHREHRRFLGGRPLAEFAAFHELTAWKHDEELSRALTEYEYLELDRQRGARWVVTNRQDPAGFRRFREAFLGVVAGHAEPAPQAREPAAPPLPQHPLPRRGGFYQSWFGKVFALAAAGASLALLAAAATGALDLGHLLRLALVVLPGTGYVLWRTFRRPRPL